MRGNNPRDIPIGNCRYDFVCVKSGRGEDGQPIIHALIDSGPYRGRRVSGTGQLRVGQRFSALLDVTYYDRLSGLPVDKGWRDGNVVIRYDLCEIGEVETGESLKTINHKRKFLRNQ